MFAFNFNNENPQESEKPSNEKDLSWHLSKEITFDKVNTLCYDNIKIKYLDVNKVIKKLKELGCEAVSAAESVHSDLIPASYEGGFKLWECTEDLIAYLVKENIDFKEKKVLDLGCGLGLLGIYAQMQGAKFVHFQDYNSEVISHLTIPNMNLNVTDFSSGQEPRFFSGDWASFTELTKNECKYDIILTSETIYNISNYKKLHDLFITRLNNDSVVFLAAKTCYFGVGGGLRQFEHFLDSKNVFSYNSYCTSKIGIKREILKIKFKSNEHT